MLKIFVAGHQGMVGSAVVRNAPAVHEIITASREDLSLTNEIEVYNFFRRERIDAVILCAAKVGGIAANASNQTDFLVSNLNIQNSVMMAAARADVGSLVFLGSSCVYPKYAVQPIKETSLLTGSLEPTNDGYAIAKIAGIRLARAIYEEQGKDFFSLMPTNLFGPGDNFDLRTSHVPAALMRRIHEAKIHKNPDVTIWGSGKARREFMHVDDMAQACWFLLRKNVKGELINVGTGCDITITEFALLMSRVVGFTGALHFDKSKPDGTPRKLLDVSKVNSLGWKHQIELEEGLRQTYAWFIEALGKGEVRGY
jgi:GDP-L-fucose synthase